MRPLEAVLLVGAGGVLAWWVYNQVAARAQAAGVQGTTSGAAPGAVGGAAGFTLLPGADQVPTAPAMGAVPLYDLATEAADQAGVDPQILRAMVSVESAWNPHARSSAGAMGLLQLMPKTAADLGVTDPWDPWQNLIGGAHYLASLVNQFGSYEPAIAAYNAGPGNVAKAIQDAAGGDWMAALARYQSPANHRQTQLYLSSIMLAAPFA